MIFGRVVIPHLPHRRAWAADELRRLSIPSRVAAGSHRVRHAALEVSRNDMSLLAAPVDGKHAQEQSTRGDHRPALCVDRWRRPRRHRIESWARESFAGQNSIESPGPQATTAALWIRSGGYKGQLSVLAWEDVGAEVTRSAGKLTTVQPPRVDEGRVSY